jgi:predicted nucleotidyltransferase
MEQTIKVPPVYRELLEEYYFALRKHFGDRLKSVCVFGSVARGNPSPESDIDVLVVIEGLPDTLDERMRLVAPIHDQIRNSPARRKVREAGRNPLISPLYFTPEEIKRHPPIMLELEEENILFDEGVLRQEIRALKRRMQELGSRKVYTSKGYYWILKPDLKPGEEVEL